MRGLLRSLSLLVVCFLAGCTLLPRMVQNVPSILSRGQGTAAATYKNIEQGVTADGFAYLGKPDAPVTLVDYSDFL